MINAELARMERWTFVWWFMRVYWAAIILTLLCWFDTGLC